MGIRPKIRAVFGIDNLNVKDYQPCDPRCIHPSWDYDDWDIPLKLPCKTDPLTHKLDWNDKEAVRENFRLNHIWSYCYDSTEKKSKCINDLLVWDSEYGLSNIIGLEVESENRDSLGWSLSACDDKFSIDGYMIAKSRNFFETTRGTIIREIIEHIKEEGRSPYSFIKKSLSDKEMKNLRKYAKLGWLYKHYDWSTVQMWADTTQFLFSQIGLSVKDEELKLMVYWNWS